MTMKVTERSECLINVGTQAVRKARGPAWVLQAVLLDGLDLWVHEGIEVVIKLNYE
jgi:hypothetical protein